ncbi:predicted protein [Lichtheimia corymbifera JMRC:FSU:9682]|uniref:MIT domain-containing protein n=1 Tax=Lichtheimia corymbifera JMRC:FSU:9682 TaxID=1263082 RepID=A0A068RQZ5_9FUNG|nr:predicted protein [Lichtheimia corymbifera JMRC:FSU:9682]
MHPPASPPTPTPEQQPPAPASSSNAKQMSKVILRTALQKANSAVMSDSSNDVVGAIDAYSEAISLLNRVLSTVEKGSDRRRLQEIHDSYSERIRLLTAISPKSEVDDVYETYNNDEEDEDEDMDEEDDARSWLSKPAKRNFSTRSRNNSTTTQSTYTSMIRRMASSSSLESSVSTPEDPRLQATPKRSHHHPTIGAGGSNNTNYERPPSPISSKSTPTRSNHRKSNSSSHHEESSTSPKPAVVDHHHQRSPSTSSNDSFGENTTAPTANAPGASNGYQPAMTLPPLSATKTESTTTTITPSGPRTSSLRHQQSNPILTDAKNTGVTAINTNTTTTTTTSPISLASIGRKGSAGSTTSNGSGSNGFASVRKSNRLSRVSMDGRGRAQAAAAPLFGLFMKDFKNDNNHHSMDYLGSSTAPQKNIGVATTTTTTSAASSSEQVPMRLVLSLEKSMEDGAYITPRLYIPKNMWHQPGIRLPHVEIKIAACESLMADLSKLERWTKLDDLTGSLKVLEGLEDAVESLKNTLAKKLKRESMNGSSNTATSAATSNGQQSPVTTTSSSSSVISMNNTIPDNISVSSISSNTSSSYKKSQAFMSWGTKLSKSVERMNAFSLTKGEDQYRNYVEMLQRLFIKLHIIVSWWDHYVAMKKDANRASLVCDVVLQRLTRICDVVDVVVGGFVVRDMAILLGKWLKRGGSWVNE